jgi:predicted DNA-binding protein
MPTSVRLDPETEELLRTTANTLNITKTDVVKASIRDFCLKILQEKSSRPYDLISDLIGKESSGKGDLAINSEEILRQAFKREK